jgi:hypothetical protein
MLPSVLVACVFGTLPDAPTIVGGPAWGGEESAAPVWVLDVKASVDMTVPNKAQVRHGSPFFQQLFWFLNAIF